jgi:DNA repair protein RecN (Recombination protein N)
MIHSLAVENIALIDKLNIEFADGLNVLTGKTGAGKSIIVGSINLVLGGRADRDMIRNGKNTAHVEAVLYIDTDALAGVFDELGIIPQEELVISRDLTTEGKNICRINGTMVNLSTLKKLMQNIVDLLGQHEHQSLLYPQNHLDVIDGYGGGEIGSLKKGISEKYAVYTALARELESLGGDEGERLKAVDYLEYQIKELDEAALRDGEEEELKEERELLANAQSISQNLCRCYELLYSGEDGLPVVPALRYCVDDISALEDYSPEYAGLSEKLKEHYYSLEDIAHEVNAFAGAWYLTKKGRKMLRSGWNT